MSLLKANPLLSGVLGAGLLQVGLKAAPGIAKVARPVAVAATAQAILLLRQLQGVAEEARLTAADIVAEAEAQTGEAPAPPDAESGHEH